MDLYDNENNNSNNSNNNNSRSNNGSRGESDSAMMIQTETSRKDAEQQQHPYAQQNGLHSPDKSSSNGSSFAAEVESGRLSLEVTAAAVPVLQASLSLGIKVQYVQIVDSSTNCI